MRIAVRQLVEFALLHGDLRVQFVGPGRAVAGTRGHRRVQKARPEGYEAEVSLSSVIERDGLTLELFGRADGVWLKDGVYTLDEIKTTTRPLLEIAEKTYPVHWGQAKVYAWMLAQQKSLQVVDVQLTYLHLETNQVKEIVQRCSAEELALFVEALISEYVEWARQLANWRDARNSSMQNLEFPFSEYRAGQRRLAVAVYKTISKGARLFAQAPTGVGKTMAILFPAMKAFGGNPSGETPVDKIFYLTAKTVGRMVAAQAMKILGNHGLRCKVLVLTAKEKICPQEETICDPEHCSYAKGYFDRLKTAAEELFTQDLFDREAIEQVAERCQVCPFEFSLYMALWADVIIADFNYAFDPRVYLRRFFDAPTENYVFLVDEAHNLPDRAREMYSAQLQKKNFLAVRRLMKTVDQGVYKALGGVNRQVGQIKKELNDQGELVAETFPEALIRSLKKFTQASEVLLVQNEPALSLSGTLWRAELLDLYFAALGFLRTAEEFDQASVFYAIGDKHDVFLKLFCLDPSTKLLKAFDRASSVVFFSATLLPRQYFSRLIGFREEDHFMTCASPFSRDNLGGFILPWVKTTFRCRETSYEDIADILHSILTSHRGNYMVFFPSYRYLLEVRQIFTNKYPCWAVVEQISGMSEEDREDFLAEFSKDQTDCLLGFVVMGGIFGEGIDLRGKKLIGAVIVGVGLPQLCLERDLIRDYFEKLLGSGFYYAYMYPGMNRVLQAGGRVIRTENDRGVVLLIDERFAEGRYRSLFPSEWKHFKQITKEGFSPVLKNFWG